MKVSAAVVITPGETPHRQIWRQSETLPPGSSLFINANSIPPLDTGDYGWVRNDLDYHVVCDGHLVEVWQRYFLLAGGDLGGNK